jgi:hypothetical protein
MRSSLLERLNGKSEFGSESVLLLLLSPSDLSFSWAPLNLMLVQHHALGISTTVN